jgi:ABC-type bacteriocin/lantibiotic exporter with double-glycine peptidase domain
MSRSQVWTTTELVVRRLGLSADPSLVAREALRDGAPSRTTAELAERLTRAASLLQLTYLRRTLDERNLSALARDEALPVVLLTPAGDAVDAWMVHGREPGLLRLARIDRDGQVEERSATPGEWMREVGGRVEALVPVPVSPSVAPEEHLAPSPMTRLLRLLGREKRDIGIVYFYATLTGLFSLALPLGVQAIVQLVSSGQLLQPVAILIAFVIAGTVASGVLQLLQLQVVEVLQQRIFARLAFEFTFRVPRLRLEQLQGADLPELMNRFFEVMSIQKALQKLLTETTTALLQVVFGLVLLTFYHPYFTLFGLALFGSLWIVFRITGPKGLETSLMESKYKYRVAHWLEEMARTVRTLKFAGRSAMPVQRMDAEIANYLKYRKKHFDVIVQQSVAIIVFKTIITGSLLVLGSILVVNRQISLGQFVASEIVVVTVLGGLEKMIVSLATVYDILTSVDKAGHVTDVPTEPGGGLSLPEPGVPVGMRVQLKDVGYSYPNNPRPAIAGVTLELAPGSTTVLTGFDGAGQTTLLKVTAGLFEHDRGALFYDGFSGHDLDRTALRSRVGLVLEQGELFDGTMEENITLGRPDVGIADVLRALDLVGIRETVLSLPQGLQTRVAAGGQLLPQTVQRKVMLARAIAGRPRLLVVDDVLQHFDTASKKQIIRMLTAAEAGWTVLAASHDPLFLASADQVVVLEEGRLRAAGAYSDLLRDPYVTAIVAGLPGVAEPQGAA